MKGWGPRKADKGEGWLACKTKQVEGLWLAAWAINVVLDWACAPHSMKTQALADSAIAKVIWSVSASQPCLAWLAGKPSSTVKQVLSNKTPFVAQGLRLASKGGTWPMSRCNSLKILRSEGGAATPEGTEKAKPSA